MTPDADTPKFDPFAAPVVSWDRQKDAQGDGEWVVLTLQGGAKVRIHTRAPLMWIQPRVH